jgi:hypothetical protein
MIFTRFPINRAIYFPRSNNEKCAQKLCDDSFALASRPKRPRRPPSRRRGKCCVCIAQEHPRGVHISRKNWVTYHAAVAAVLDSCWPTHPDSGFFAAASGLGSPKVLQLLAPCSSVPNYRESARSRRMAVAPEERFGEIYADVTVVAAGSTRTVLLLLLGC